MSRNYNPIYLKTNFIYAFAIIASIVLSIWIPYRETVINPDAICYLLSSEQIGIAGLKSAMHLCGQANWPFYSALIYGFSSLTHTSSMFAAYFIDGVFTLISVLMFIAILDELGASRGVLWFGALTILLAHDFNSVRQYIVRDHGFFAFYLVSIFALLRYSRLYSWKSAFTWSISILIAALFRVEGAIFFMLVPFSQLFTSRYSFAQRVRGFLQLNAFALVLAAVALGWIVWHSQSSIEHFGRIPELARQVQEGWHAIVWRWTNTRDGLLNHVLDASSARDANMLTTFMVVMGYLANTLSVLTPIYALLALYAWLSRTILWTRNHAVVILSYFFINILITAAFYAQHLFLSKRYLIALSLIVMLWVPYALDKLYRKSHRKYHKLAFGVAMGWMMIASLGGIFDFGYSKAYIHRAGDWLAKRAPGNASVYANSSQIMFYSHHFNRDLFAKKKEYEQVDILANKQWQHYDYLALLVKDENDKKIMTALHKDGLKPARVYSNKRGDMVAIYRVKQENTF